MKKTWGQIFKNWRRKGADPSDAAFRADEYEKKQEKVARAYTRPPDPPDGSYNQVG